MPKNSPGCIESSRGLDPIYDSLIALTEKHSIYFREAPIKKYEVNGIYSEIKSNGMEINLIIIDCDLELSKKCFVLAHELAHFTLHRGQMEEIQTKNRLQGLMHRWDSTSEMEMEADRFANRLVRFLTGRLEVKVPEAA